MGAVSGAARGLGPGGGLLRPREGATEGGGWGGLRSMEGISSGFGMATCLLGFQQAGQEPGVGLLSSHVLVICMVAGALRSLQL